jgi:hypothetical protein
MPLSRLHRHDDFAELLVRLQEPMRGHDVVERERLCDDRPQLARSQPLEHERLGNVQSRWATDDFVDEVAAQGQRFA